MTSTIVQGIVVPYSTALSLALLRKHNIDTTWFKAVGRSGGVAYSHLLASGKSPTDKGALIEAAKPGADYLTVRVGGIAASKALDPNALAQIAGAELGKLLGLDPAISTGGSTVSTVAGPGQTATAVVEAAQ